MNETLWHALFTGVAQFRGDLTYLTIDGDTYEKPGFDTAQETITYVRLLN